jgi:dCMP deaminase
MDDWDKRFLEMAALVGSWSKDPSTKVGAVLVKDKRILSTGYNGLPTKIGDDPQILNDRSEKYRHIIHAEENALLYCSIHGVSSMDTTLYVSPLPPCTLYVSPLPPCAGCMRLIIQAGVTRIVCPKPSKEHEERWGNSLQLSRNLAYKAKVILEEID